MKLDAYTIAIFHYIKKHNGKNIKLKEIVQNYGISKPTVTNRIQKLISEGIIEKTSAWTYNIKGEI